MKSKKIQKKLSLTKSTIANLEISEQKQIKGGTWTDLPEATCRYVSCTCVMPCYWP